MKISFRFLAVCFALFGLTLSSTAHVRVFDAAQMGLRPHSSRNASAVMQRIISKIKQQVQPSDSVVLHIARGTYHFHEKGAALRSYYISNHDQDSLKKVGMAFEDFHHFTLQGNGASFVFHGRMLPLSLVGSSHCTLQNFSIDFAIPHITQVQIIENRGDEGMVFAPAPYVQYRITPDSLFEAYGEGWSNQPFTGIAFEEKTRHVVYQTGDLYYNLKGTEELEPGSLYAPQWRDARLVPGTVVAMRNWLRPAPGIFLAGNLNTCLSDINVHYAEGMGLLAQQCENITLTRFNVCINPNDEDHRYFTTQADATHFSGCKGKIVSKEGLYEGMMDDAINVHGTYLKVVKRIDSYTLVGRYMHNQSWGFEWGQPGDRVQFVRSATMDLLEGQNTILSIQPYDKDTVTGAKEFIIRFSSPVQEQISEHEGFGIENLTWTPQVEFVGNTIRNNRARGALFSTPQPVLVEHNLFDHTSGTAILLCGDCNGWYETGACRNVVIRHNRFVNALTSLYQFTSAVISIYPEIPDLKHQQTCFHGGYEGGIVIEDNQFDTFDYPVLYAKSVNGLFFRNNVIRKNHDYAPFHTNTQVIKLEKVDRVELR